MTDWAVIMHTYQMAGVNSKRSTVHLAGDLFFAFVKTYKTPLNTITPGEYYNHVFCTSGSNYLRLKITPVKLICSTGQY